MPWKIHCEQFKLDFTVPSREDKPESMDFIPGINYATTSLSAASWAFCTIVRDARPTKDQIDYLTWTVTSHDGKVGDWSTERLDHLTALEHLAG